MFTTEKKKKISTVCTIRMAHTHDDMQSTEELLQAQLELWHHSFSYVKSMALKCAVELRIPDAIHRCGGAATLPELLPKLALHPSKLPHLRRLMRLLTVSGVFAVPQTASEDCDAVYGLTPVSRLLVCDKASLSQCSFVRCAVSPLQVIHFFDMSAWFADEQNTSLFQMANGHAFWELAERDPALNKTFNECMAADSRLVMEIVLRESSDVFRRMNSLVDVAGGKGRAAIAIAKAFPLVTCTVLDLPDVVAQAPAHGNVRFVAGNMFQHVPPADAVLLKSVLHDWGDDECIKILRKCKEAIPSKEAGGKVIIIDMVVGFGSQDNISKEVQLFFDIYMHDVSP